MILELENIHTYYGASHILHGLSLQVKQNGLTVLLGRNGMGKTTTMRSIIGFTSPKAGKIRFDGREIQNLHSYQIARSGIAIAPQGRRIFPNLTVKENLTFAARTEENSQWTLEKVYDFFPRLLERAHSLGGNLSGGEQQMLSIGRALMTNPKLLLMDEPTEGLSPSMVQELKKLIVKLKSMGLTILMVEQNLSMALSLADEIYILSKGQVVFNGTPEELKANDEIKHQHLGVAN